MSVERWDGMVVGTVVGQSGETGEIQDPFVLETAVTWFRFLFQEAFYYCKKSLLELQVGRTPTPKL